MCFGSRKQRGIATAAAAAAAAAAAVVVVTVTSRVTGYSYCAIWKTKQKKQLE